MTKFFGKEPSEEGLKEVTDSMQALNDLRYKVRFTINYGVCKIISLQNGNSFLVGDSLTLADLVLAVNITMCTVIGEYDMATNYPNILKCLSECQKLPEWQAVDKKMMDMMAAMADAMAAKKAAAEQFLQHCLVYDIKYTGYFTHITFVT